MINNVKPSHKSGIKSITINGSGQSASCHMCDEISSAYRLLS